MQVLYTEQLCAREWHKSPRGEGIVFYCFKETSRVMWPQKTPIGENNWTTCDQIFLRLMHGYAYQGDWYNILLHVNSVLKGIEEPPNLNPPFRLNKAHRIILPTARFCGDWVMQSPSWKHQSLWFMHVLNILEGAYIIYLNSAPRRWTARSCSCFRCFNDHIADEIEPIKVVLERSVQHLGVLLR